MGQSALDLHSVQTRLPARQIDWYPVIDSTMNVAAGLARANCPSGTVVGADEQTVGIGRLGRSWNSQAEAGLYVSIILRLPLAGNTAPLVMLALGLAVKQSIESLTTLACDLRWPNDVLITGSNARGSWRTGKARDHRRHWDQRQPERIPDRSGYACPFALLQGARVKREDLLVELLESVDSCVEVLPRHADEILRRFMEASSLRRAAACGFSRRAVHLRE